MAARKKAPATKGKPRKHVKYSEALTDTICGHLISGLSIRAVCDLRGMPAKSNIFEWLGRYPEFRTKYELALQERAQTRFEGLDDIMDGLRSGALDPRAARVMVDTIKWQCAIERPERYGQVSRHEVTGKGGGPMQTQTLAPADMTPEQRREEIRRLLAEQPQLASTLTEASS